MEISQIISEIVEHLKLKVKNTDWDNNWGNQSKVVTAFEQLSNGFTFDATACLYAIVHKSGHDENEIIEREVEECDVCFNVYDQNEHRIIFPNQGIRIRTEIEKKLLKYAG